MLLLIRALAGVVVLALLALDARAESAILHYRDFTVDTSIVRGAANFPQIESSLKKQLDIVADCGAKAETMAFFRSQKMTLKFGGEDGGGRFSPNGGVEIDATPAPANKPIVLHELLHAMHARYLPQHNNNPDVIRFYNNALRGQLYPAGSYVLKNRNEFFAVTASLYLWGFVARPPNNRETLKAKQPVYYAWLGDLFGVQK